MTNSIKVRVNGKWIFAQLISRSGLNEKAKVELLSGRQIVVEPQDIKNFVPLPDSLDDQNDQILKSMFDEVFELLQHTLPDECHLIRLDADNKRILGYRDRFSITMTIMEIETISSIKEVLGWKVTSIYRTFDAESENNNNDEIIGTFLSKEAAAEEFVKAIFAMKIEDYFWNRTEALQDESYNTL